jgi:transposase
VAALQSRAAIAPLCYGGTARSAFFEDRFKNRLLPRVPKGCTVIMDNASFHRKKALRKIARGSVRLLFLPPYSPDFSPIEKTRAHLKKRLRGNASCFDTLENAVCAFL